MGLRLSVLFESIVFRQLRFFMRGNNLEGLVRVPSSCCFSGKLLSWTTGLEWAAEYADLHPPPPPASLYNLSSSPLPKTIPSTRGSHNVSTMPVEEWHGGMGGCGVFFSLFFSLSVQDLSISLDISLMRYVRVHFKIKQRNKQKKRLNSVLKHKQWKHSLALVAASLQPQV